MCVPANAAVDGLGRTCESAPARAQTPASGDGMSQLLAARYRVVAARVRCRNPALVQRGLLDSPIPVGEIEHVEPVGHVHPIEMGLGGDNGLDVGNIAVPVGDEFLDDHVFDGHGLEVQIVDRYGMSPCQRPDFVFRLRYDQVDSTAAWMGNAQ